VRKNAFTPDGGPHRPDRIRNVSDGLKRLGEFEAAEMLTDYAALLRERESASARVPDGWQLVPIEPTDEMIDKGTDQYECEQGDTWYRNHQLSEGDCIAIYKAMLAAAPKPEKE
jgi:hypothetical protein